MKRCRKCRTEKIEAEFSRLSDSRDGLDPWCRSCKAARFKMWRELNRERNNAKKREDMKQLVEARKASGLCPRCGKEPRSGMVTCKACSQRSPEVLRGLREQAHHRKSSGMCAACGKPSDGRRYCPECRRKRDSRFQELRAQGLASGVCWKCGETARDGYALCAGCLEMLNRSAQSWSGRKASRHRIGQQLKHQVVDAYGGECICCGVSDLQLLTIDHIDGGGAHHRRAIGEGRIYYWLRANGFPSGFQVLCWNCNVGKYRNRNVCPHVAISGDVSKAKMEILAAYGGTCAICFESEPRFLELHHICNDGAGDRRKNGIAGAFWKYLKEQGYPSHGLVVLCANCHRGETMRQICSM